jgi:molybdopterin molybdotransferase
VSTLKSWDEALDAVLERAHPLPAERVALEAAARRVLAAAARAACDLPPFPSSAMDGFAVRGSDTPGTLPIVCRVAAGRPAPRPLEPGEAMAISTGGVVPDGADAVVPLEGVVDRDNEVEIPNGVKVGANVRPRGGDVAAGATVVDAGELLGPAQIGALAAAGVSEVECARQPRVCVLTTGTELKRPGEALGPGEIYEANGVMLAVLLGQAGADVGRLAAVADDEDVHRAALERGLEADVLVTSGGVSVGPHDLVRRVAAELGVEEVFWGVSVKPGKPLAFGMHGRTLVFGLPGNPVSSLVSARLFVVPALFALQGFADPRPRFEPGRLARPVRPDKRRTELLRARASDAGDHVLLDPVSGQESHMIARAAEADVLLLVPPGESELPEGAFVRYLRIVR